jgi:predicted XRE-type DNA-binding protein
MTRPAKALEMADNTRHPRMLVTDEFREALRRWVSEKSGRQAELARAIGRDASNISNLLNKPLEYQTSVLVIPICEYTGIPVPDVSVLPEEENDLLGRLRKMRAEDPATYDVIVALLRSRS